MANLTIPYVLFFLVLSSFNLFALNEQQEERAQNIFKEIRCLVCQGQTIYESNSEVAEDLKVLINEMIVSKKSDKEIKNFLTSKYGDWILMTPPVNRMTYFLWYSPFIILIFGFIFFINKFLKSLNDD